MDSLSGQGSIGLICRFEIFTVILSAVGVRARVYIYRDEPGWNEWIYNPVLIFQCLRGGKR